MRLTDMIITYIKAHPGEGFTILDLSMCFGWEMDLNVRNKLSKSVNNLARYGWVVKMPYTAVERSRSEYRLYIATP